MWDHALFSGVGFFNSALGWNGRVKQANLIWVTQSMVNLQGIVSKIPVSTSRKLRGKAKNNQTQ